jgi:hypothetical protein
MAITTRARMASFLAIAALLVAGVAGARYVGASQPVAPAGSEPGSGGGGNGVAGICVAPTAKRSLPQRKGATTRSTTRS